MCLHACLCAYIHVSLCLRETRQRRRNAKLGKAKREMAFNLILELSSPGRCISRFLPILQCMDYTKMIGVG